jgi:calcium-translocating P-type ATPase
MPSARPEGLTSIAAAARLVQDGPNVLPAAHRTPSWIRLGAQMTHFFAVMLWVAGGLAFVAGMPQLGVAVFVVIVVNGVFAFVQEHRAERAVDRLRDLLPSRVIVRRDGVRHEIASTELVRGDVVILEPGDRISADLDVFEAHALALDTSALTGESVPAALAEGGRAFAGTFVVTGQGEGVVAGTGGATRLAGIARLTGDAERPTGPLQLELHRVVRVVATMAVTVGTGFLLLSLLFGQPARNGFLFAIGVTVALVPEGLLPTVTLSLALAAQNMAGRNALVRRLEAVETLGSTTFICTDKTGTLTRGQMAVVEVWTPAGQASVRGEGYEPTGEVDAPKAAIPALLAVARAGTRCSAGRAVEREGRWVAIGDPMEAALYAFARRLGFDPGRDEEESPVLQRFPFDPERRRASVVAGDWLYLKGAPDAVLPRCSPVLQTAAVAQLDAMADRGLRVLAVARRPAADVPDEADPDGAERDLELLGLVGLEDPPRGDVMASLVACRSAGIKVAMVTGDHPGTARAVAEEVGLLGPERIVLEGEDLPGDLAALGALLDYDGVVVSRVTPEDKLRIAEALQRRGHVVAMTGDGVNDGPALRKADIGVAMGLGGTDVAREAADLVLLDDHFATIVAAIEQGRATFANIRRFLTYHLTDNVAELTPFVVWALSGGQFPLALGVLQILFLDIGTDLLPALALGAEPADPAVLRQRPRPGHLVDAALLRRVFGVLGSTEALMEMLAFVAALAAAGWRPGDSFPSGHALFAASGAAFMAVVFGQLANAFACRSTTRRPDQVGWGSNRLLLAAVAVELVLLLAFLGVPAIAGALDHAPPPLVGAVVAILAAPAVLAADATHKRLRRR